MTPVLGEAGYQESTGATTVSRAVMGKAGNAVFHLAGNGEPLRRSEQGDVMRLELLSRKLTLALGEACTGQGGPVAGDQGEGRGWWPLGRGGSVERRGRC